MWLKMYKQSVFITFPFTLYVHFWPHTTIVSIILSVGTLSSGVIYAMLTRPNKVETAVHGCQYFELTFCFLLVVIRLIPSNTVAFVRFLGL